MHVGVARENSFFPGLTVWVIDGDRKHNVFLLLDAIIVFSLDF
jgi:hypothetical protein